MMTSPTTTPGFGDDLAGPSYFEVAGDEASASSTPDVAETAVNISKLDMDSLGNDASPPVGAPDEVEDLVDKVMASRAYQLEMLDRCLRENVIVAMDTGSGKTQVAVLRIRAEIERGAPEKLIWFLAPTVLLCSQQHDVLKLQLPSTNMKLLTGADDLDTWSAPIWEAILQGVRVVVSTPQVLYDALAHAYVGMAKLALLVFDEAHRCIGKNPGSKIMRNFYHPQKQQGQSVPSILGMTASPSTSSTTDFEDLETTLDGRCVTPTLHREELLKHVNRPQISRVDVGLAYYPPHTASLSSLRKVHLNLDITEDPYILSLLNNLTDRNRRRLDKAIEKHDTFSQEQMQGLVRRSREIAKQLGTWAANYYVWRTITDYLEKFESNHSVFGEWLNEEKEYLASALRQVTLITPPESPQRSEDMSEKVRLLIKELLEAESPFGVVFAEERATVSMLYELLSSIPELQGKFRFGAVVGTSNYHAKQRSIYEFDINSDLTVLQRFRSGKINLLIATSVLEEGIDVPACNLVICFDQMTSLRSFIQRRGRARMRESRLVVFSEGSTGGAATQWQAMEKEMKQQYEDEEREWNRLETLEESELSKDLFLSVPSTGARIDFDDAKGHLDHFCRTLSLGEFVDARPDYIIHGHDEGSGTTLTATVLLPSFLPAAVRQAEGQHHWKSEKNATKDAAFQAYVALYNNGLLSDRLLPFKPDRGEGVEGRASIASVEAPLDPWREVAQAWNTGQQQWVYALNVLNERGQALGGYYVTLPIELRQPDPIRLYIDYDQTWEVRLGPGRSITGPEASNMPDHTSVLLSLHFGHRWPVELKQHVVKFTTRDADIAMDQIGSQPFNGTEEQVLKQQCFLRDNLGAPLLFQELIPSRPSAELVQEVSRQWDEFPEDDSYVVVKKWTKRADFLHRIPPDASRKANSSKPYPKVLPLSWVKADTVPIRHAQFAMLIPTITHEFEVALKVKHLTDGLLKPVGIADLSLVREAISARSASEAVDYERIEFLGDSILKYSAAILAAVVNPTWPEGYLSLWKDRLVSNSRLSRASMEKGLSKYILSKTFTGHKWRPLYLDKALNVLDSSTAPTRELSTKTLADVVEALIGVAYQDGGLPKALRCISVFVSEKDWSRVLTARDELFDLAQPLSVQPSVLEPLEELLGYSFQKKSILLEAMTHPSFKGDLGQRSFDRLEFIGDAVLDDIIVTELFASQPPLPNNLMHTLKTAVVNGDFLAFLALEYSLRQEEAFVTKDLNVEKKDVFVSLWKFMRHSEPSVALEQAATTSRHEDMRGEILEAMEMGTHYPWALLARLQAKKFYSDFVEALLGAIYIDSGSLEKCKAFITRLGITKYLDRILRDGVQCQHPKELIGIHAGNKKVKYEVIIENLGNGVKEYKCAIHVGERVVCRVEKGVSQEEVKTKAATKAVRILESEKGAKA